MQHAAIVSPIYRPTIKGSHAHELHIKAKGQHIPGSPFSVAVTAPIEELRTEILTIGAGGVSKPKDVAMKQSREVVEGRRRPCVSVFRPGGTKLKSFGTLQGQFIDPCGVTVDG